MNRLLLIGVFVFAGLAVCGQRVAPELFAPGVISGPENDAAPAFSPDGNTVYFHRSGPDMTASIFVSHRQTNGEWTKPELASFSSGKWKDIEPAMAPDGSYLIFASSRPVAAGGKGLTGNWNSQRYPDGGGNLWRVDRKGDGWGEPYRLPDVVNGDSSVFSPAVTADGSLFFMKPMRDTGKFHLYRCAYHRGEYGPPVAVPFSAADSVSDVDPTVAADESFLVFSSRRPPAKSMELFIVFKKNGVWGVPRSLGVDVNRGVGNIEARLGPGGRSLYFSCVLGEGLLNIWSVPLNGFIEK